MLNSLLIFTDLDGTLLNHEDYDYRAALPMLAKLQELQIPVIPVTSKTRAEVASLRQEIGLNAPFIVENGSGIFLPQTDNRFANSDVILEGDYRVKQLGCTYIEARAGLRIIQSQVREILRGFGDFSDIEVANLTGLSKLAAKQAKAREFSEPFVTPKEISIEDLENTAAEYGFRVLIGDRFCHLLGADAGKGKAVTWLLNLYRSNIATDNILTIGLGNSPNDLEMLEAVDIPIVIANQQGIHPDLANRGWLVPQALGAAGWAEAIAGVLAKRQ
jgi:mannosyl-3-phosphoglycerate phosphatase